ncbi:MAG TPA: ATP-binding protein, partial [Opitutales bacterium]|nr:ATP-binding protein [Opitutales bacterium]
LLHEELPPEKRRQFIENIKTESVRLQNLVDQLLALSSLENRTELGAPTKVSLVSLLRRVVNQHQSNALDKNLQFELQAAEDISVQGEEFLLETALNNLLQNAIDFSPKGSAISLHLEAQKDQALITITDEGPGIPEYAYDRIFDRFYSLPRPGSERKSSGLGLCFAREAIELHGGKLSIRNRECGPGAKVMVALPRQ